MSATVPGSFHAPLRPDLEFVKGAAEPGGAPTWLLHDAFAGRFVRIGWLEYEILRRWHLNDARAIVASVRRETTLDADTEDVMLMNEFLSRSGLLRQGALDGAAAEPTPHWSKTLGSWRFPLLRPNQLLDRSLWIPRALLSIPGLILLFALAVFCAVEITRNLAWFAVSFRALFDPALIGSMVVALVCAKLVHEMGHAWACRQHGLDVPTMGVSVFFMWPFFYTETSSAWRLERRRDRAFIASAGVLAEIVLGVFALTAWCVLPDGLLRQTMLFLGSFSIGASLLVNANPFMKWDGYYVMSDALGIENFQERANTFGRWSLRRLIFAARTPPPEVHASWVRRWLVFYSWGAWLYRVVLFSGLALLLYSFFFKLAGVMLMAFVVMRYMLGPLIREIRSLNEDRDQFQWGGPNRVGLAALAFVVALLCLPVDRSVTLSAVMRPQVSADLYAPAPGRVLDAAVIKGAQVQPGEALVNLSSQVLDNETRVAELELARVRTLVDRGGSGDARDTREIVQRQLQRQKATLSRLVERAGELELRAPFEGVVTWTQHDLRPGRWVSDREPLLRVVDPDTVEVVAYADAATFGRLAEGHSGVFVPHDTEFDRVGLELVRVDASPAAQVDEPGLIATHGGDVTATSSGIDGNWFGLVFSATDSDLDPMRRELVGKVVVDATGDWLLGPLIRRVRHLLVRESAF